jgi:hypothetical protein
VRSRRSTSASTLALLPSPPLSNMGYWTGIARTCSRLQMFATAAR